MKASEALKLKEAVRRIVNRKYSSLPVSKFVCCSTNSDSTLLNVNLRGWTEQIKCITYVYQKRGCFIH